jgi:hypothetical protein
LPTARSRSYERERASPEVDAQHARSGGSNFAGMMRSAVCLRLLLEDYRPLFLRAGLETVIVWSGERGCSGTLPLIPTEQGVGREFYNVWCFMRADRYEGTSDSICVQPLHRPIFDLTPLSIIYRTWSNSAGARQKGPGAVILTHKVIC